jgi:hypothetical protein
LIALAGSKENKHRNTMKGLLLSIALGCAVFAQIHFLGLNGLTLISAPLTIYLGLLVIEKTTEEETI